MLVGSATGGTKNNIFEIRLPYVSTELTIGEGKNIGKGVLRATAFTQMETSLSPGLGLGTEATVKGPPFWMAWYCVAATVAIFACLRAGRGYWIDVLAVRRLPLCFNVLLNFPDICVYPCTSRKEHGRYCT